MEGTSSGTRPSAALSWLPVSAATRWVLSVMDLIMTCLRCGPPYPWLAGRLLPHQSSLAFTRIWEFLSHSTNLYGPLPTGSCQKSSTFFFMAAGEAIAKGDMVRFLTKGPTGSVRENRTGVLIHNVDALDDGVVVEAPELGGVVGEFRGPAPTPLVVGVLGVSPAVEVELHRIGVELRPVVELDAIAQLDGVGKPAVFRLWNLGREGRRQFEGPGLEA